MKKSLYGLAFCISTIFAACSQTRSIQREDYYTDDPSNSISYQQFYDDLSPYGQWIDSPEFGNVWVPRQTGFRPYYSDGYWAYTNYGWTWVSNYNWGWAPFHYGSWYYDNFYGWAWVPGYEWAPAWVDWRSNSQYYGWAPQCPRRRDGSYYQVRNDQWAFVPHQYITQRSINNYYISPQNNTTIINNTREINNVRVINRNARYQVGPSVNEVEKATNSRIRPLVVKSSSAPGDTKLENGALRIFKPTVKTTNTVAEKSANSNPVKAIERRNAPEAAPPVSQAPQTNDNTISTNDRMRRQVNENKLNNVKMNPAEPNNTSTDNDNRTSTPIDKRTRPLPNEQNQPDRNAPQNGDKTTSNDNDQTEQIQQKNRIDQALEIQRQQQAQEVERQQQQAEELQKQRQAQERVRQVPQENRTNINVPQRRFENPRENSDKGYQRERMINNNRQQNPSFERRAETVPNNPPVQQPVRFSRPREDVRK